MTHGRDMINAGVELQRLSFCRASSEHRLIAHRPPAIREVGVFYLGEAPHRQIPPNSNETPSLPESPAQPSKVCSLWGHSGETTLWLVDGRGGRPYPPTAPHAVEPQVQQRFRRSCNRQLWEQMDGFVLPQGS